MNLDDFKQLMPAAFAYMIIGAIVFMFGLLIMALSILSDLT